MAGIELASLSALCLDRRLPDHEILAQEVVAWENGRNQTATQVNWRFAADARIKLKHFFRCMSREALS